MDSRQSWRQRLYIIIFETSTPAAQRFDNWLLVTILASLVVVMLDSVEHFHNQYAEVFRALEWFFTVLFAIEYGLRLYISPKPMRYAFSFFGLVDLLAVLPAILALMFADAQYLMIVRAIRLIRVFRVLKLRQYLSQANFLLVALRGSKQKIIVFLVSVSTLVTVYGALMYVIEGPANGFTSIPISIYWAVVTLTTVGFGDITPQTPIGQMLATLVMITGYSIIAVPTGIFTAELANAMRLEGQMEHDCPHCKKPRHEHNASYCNRCGGPLYSRAPQALQRGDTD
ncbi:ion transporter [Ectopseudomonas hydrolytica]|uniref:ion transporter n=1 Tax=Ectopseudomonas hydrolytica TaxID=2493633 RepID=UPI0002787A0E|nr:ion transporter [Pseudomonas hydrolytica]EJO94102.1 Ion transport protein [Pseudomonas mendocina DLHK]MBF8164445.1 ion transporter [Pseudomonas mendocina]UTH33424.1 ion transporter [Pseudomonas hydrolytica]UZZ12696.1 ion transporter [Pseudomonas mendocina]